MFINLAIGGVLVTLSFVTHASGLLVLSGLLRRTIRIHEPCLNRWTAAGIMVLTVLGIFVVHIVEIWTWAMGYLVIGATSNFYRALVFSTLSFSTLGAESVALEPEWVLLGSIEGVAGFLLIGWSTAYLIPAWTRYGPFHGDRDF